MLERLSVSILLSSAPASSETLMPDAGAQVVVLSTTITSPEAPYSLHSTYVGQRGADTATTHLLLAPGQQPAFEQRRVSAHELPVAADERQLCLYDHLQHLLAALIDDGYRARINVGDRSIALVNR